MTIGFSSPSQIRPRSTDTHFVFVHPLTFETDPCVSVPQSVPGG